MSWNNITPAEFLGKDVRMDNQIKAKADLIEGIYGMMNDIEDHLVALSLMNYYQLCREELVKTAISVVLRDYMVYEDYHKWTQTKDLPQ